MRIVDLVFGGTTKGMWSLSHKKRETEASLNWDRLV
jgi:hypothetical protein